MKVVIFISLVTATFFSQAMQNTTTLRTQSQDLTIPKKEMNLLLLHIAALKKENEQLKRYVRHLHKTVNRTNQPSNITSSSFAVIMQNTSKSTTQSSRWANQQQPQYQNAHTEKLSIPTLRRQDTCGIKKPSDDTL